MVDEDGWPNDFDTLHWLSLVGSAVVAVGTWLWYELTSSLWGKRGNR